MSVTSPKRTPRGTESQAMAQNSAADSELVSAQRKRRLKLTALTVALSVALFVLVIISAATGQLQLPASEVLSSLLHKLGLGGQEITSHPQGESALWTIRFPRVALAALVGAALAVGGAIMQGVFGNPLADPGVVGVSSGAAAAASAAMVFNITIFGAWTTPLFAFIGGLAVTMIVYFMSRANGRTEVVTLVLTGVAINAFAGAVIAFLTFVGDQQSREQIVFWQLGSLNGTRWQYVAVVAPLVILGIIGAMVLSRKLDLLALGDKSARHLGVNVERLRITSIVIVAVLTAAAVAFSGIIAFVGLVIPHIVRMLIGPGHRALIPISALGGAVLLSTADLVARTAVQYADLPIGMLTSLVGGPFFFYLIRKTRKSSGGWA